MPARIRNYFLTGLVVAGPVLITAYLTWSFITWVDDLVRPFIPPTYRPETYLPWPIPGTGLVIAFIALTLLGFLTANLVGRSLVELGEGLLNRMPIVRPVYKTMKQIFETLFSKDGSSFRKVALAEFPAPGMWSLVFISQPPSGELAAETAARRTRLVLSALYAEPDHRLFLLRQARRIDRTRHLGRERHDAADFGRHGAARRRRAEEAGRHGGERQGVAGGEEARKASNKFTRTSPVFGRDAAIRRIWSLATVVPCRVHIAGATR